MTKFWAMLKDSFREAVDGWIFLVMLVLAGVLTLLVFSMSAEPVPLDKGAEQIVRGDALRIVSADRGEASRIGMFFYQPRVTDVTTGPPAAHPWETSLTFTVEFASAGFGPGGMEVDDAKNPKDVKQIDGGGLFADAFKEAVRYWGGKPGEKKPEYTEALAAEFVTAQLKDACRLNVTGVTKVGVNKYRVTADGVTDKLAWPHTPSLFFGAWKPSYVRPLGSLVQLVEGFMVNSIGAWVLLLTGVIVTAGFIPNMLQKGAIDLFLTKPLSRVSLLWMKYVGGLLFVFLLSAIAVGGVWVAIGVRTGVWSTGLLVCVFGITAYFAILYAVSTLFGVLSRNAIVCIVVTIVFWFILYLIGLTHNTLTMLNNLEVQRQRPAATSKEKPADGKKTEAPKDDDGPSTEGEKIPQWALTTAEVLNRATPRVNDLDTLTDQLISKDLLSTAEKRAAGQRMRSVEWGEVLGVAGAYIVFFLGLATVRFVTRSY